MSEKTEPLANGEKLVEVNDLNLVTSHAHLELTVGECNRLLTGGFHVAFEIECQPVDLLL